MEPPAFPVPLLLIAALLCAMAVADERPIAEWVFPTVEVARETPLVGGGRALGAVVYPAGDAEYRALAERVAVAVEQATGVALPLLGDDQVTAEWCGPIKPEHTRMPLVILGDINHNRATIPVYARYLCECDANYPGAGGHVLRTVVAPYRPGANYIILAGPGRDEMTAAVDRFIEVIGDAAAPGDLTVPWLLEMELGEAWADTMRTALGHKPVDAAQRGLPTYMIANYAKNFALTGSERTLQTVRNWFVHHAARPKGLVTSDYSMEEVVRAWDFTRDSAIYTPEETAAIETALLQTLAHQQTQYWCELKPDESLGTRHQVAGTFAFLLMAQSLRRHCPDGNEVAARLDEWIAGAKSYLSCFAERRSYHAERDSNSAFQVMGLIFTYALREGETDIFTNGTARQGVRKAVAVIDNLGYGAGLQNYEDTYSGHVRTAYLVGEPLSLAAFYYRDPHLKWLTDNWPGCEFKTWFSHGYGIEHAWATGEALASQPPTGEDFIGFAAAHALGDRHQRNLEAGRTRLPWDQCFDKLALRGAFDRRATYLCVQGMEPLMDWRDDAGSIIRMTERGRICLFHNNKWPSRFHKNGVLVSRGFSSPPPRAARREIVANFGGAGLCRVSLPGYRGTDWTRSIFWLRDGFTVVLDDVVAVERGECATMCCWRTPVTATLEGRRWSSRERGVDFHVISDATMRASTVPEPMVGWEVGLRGSGLRQIQRTLAAEGETLHYRNLLYTSPAADDPGLDIRRVSEDIGIIGPEPLWLVGRGPFAHQGIETDAALFAIGPDRALLAGATFLHIGGEEPWSSDQGQDAEVKLASVPRVLAGVWASAANPDLTVAEDVPAEGPLDVAWEFDGLERPAAPIRGLTVTSPEEGATGLEFLGNEEITRDQRQCADLQGAPTLFIDLHEPHTITGLRLWLGAAEGYRSQADLAPPVEAMLAFSDRADFAGSREEAVSMPRGLRYLEQYKTQIYANEYSEVTGLSERARYLRLRLPEHVTRVLELEVLGEGTGWPEPLEARTANLDGAAPGEIVLTARTGEIIALSAKGEPLWSRRLAGEPLSVAAGDHDGDGRDEVAVSALDGGVHLLDDDGGDQHLAQWPQRFGGLQYDLEFGPGSARPLLATSYYDVARLDRGAEPRSLYIYGMWCYDLLPPTADLDGEGGPEFIVHDIYGRTRPVDVEGLRALAPFGTVRGRLSHWQLVDLPGRDAPALVVIGWDGLGMYDPTPDANPIELWRREDNVRIFAGLVADARILVGRADGYLAEFDLHGEPLADHWIGWPVKALAQLGDHILAGTDGGVYCLDRERSTVQHIPGPCGALAEVHGGVLALMLDGHALMLRP